MNGGVGLHLFTLCWFWPGNGYSAIILTSNLHKNRGTCCTAKLPLYIIFFFISETEFRNVTHSLDVWHKSKSIKKCLDKVSQYLNLCLRIHYTIIKCNLLLLWGISLKNYIIIKSVNFHIFLYNKDLVYYK